MANKNNFLLLPDEVHLYIFNNLTINQIVSCKLVCKRWYFVLNKLRIRSLVVARESNLPNNKHWLTYKFVNCLHLIQDVLEEGDQNSLIDPESINNKLNQPLFNNIRSLYVYNIYQHNLFTNLLNKFEHLERIEFIYSRLKSQPVSKNCILDLNNLKILHISDAFNDGFVLNTPKLSYIKLNITHLDKVNFNYPEKIKLFETLRYNEIIKIFKNIEYLFVKNINELDSDFLLKIPNLRELHFEGQKRIFYILEHQKTQFKRNDLKLYYFGLNLESIPDHSLKNNKNYLNEKAIELFGDNYEKMASVLPFVHQIDYCDIETRFNSKIPSCFIKRFVNLNYLVVNSNVKDQDQLCHFLEDCDILRSLVINSSLDQNFYNSLPLILPYLEYLSITNKLKLSFDFLLNFKILKLIKLDHNLGDEIVSKILNKFNDLFRLEYTYQSTNVDVKLEAAGAFKLKIGENQALSFPCIDELLAGLKFQMHSIDSVPL